MKKKDFSAIQWPTIEQLEAELRRERKTRGRRFFLKGLCWILTIAVLAAVAAAFVLTPVLHINGDSMAPALTDSDIVIAYTQSEIRHGHVIAFYYNNKLLVKRVIALGGDEVNIDLLGNVSVNGERLDEPYVSNRAQGDCDIKFPYKVPNGYVFVMGDKRADSLDSRSTAIGCVAGEQIFGRVFAQLWPPEEIRWVGDPIFD